jgi:flagellar hook assembly protein FlgD
MPKPGMAAITICNAFGQTVWKQENVGKSAGNQEVVWNGLNTKGSMVSPGVYWISVNGNGFNKLNKIMVVN